MNKSESLLENLSPLAIKEIADQIKKQTAEPEDAYRLMMLFCDCIKNTRELPKELLNHFEAVFMKIVNGELNSDRALGIKRSNNRPPVSGRIGVLIAHKFLQLRLEGKTYETAVDLTSGEYGIGTTKVKKAWENHKEQALNTERMHRHLSKNTFTTRERKLIDVFYKDEPYYTHPFYPNTKAE